MILERGGAAVGDGVDEAPLASPGPDETSRAMVERAEARMLQLLPRRMNIGAFAAQNGLSLSHLERFFQEVRGGSTYHTFLLRRLERVEQLVAENHLPLKVAAARCGFGHFGVFKRAFIANFGRDPPGGGFGRRKGGSRARPS